MKNLFNFLKSNFGAQAANSLKPLSGGGSSRKYYRFESEEKTFIITENSNIEENKTFLYFTEHFSKFLDNLPKIEAVSNDFSLYVQTDLGNQTLMDLIIPDKNSAKKFYEESIRQLVKMQISGNENLDYSNCFSYPKFNSTLVLRDLFSFKNYFLNLIGIEFNQGKLIADFEKFAFDFQRIQFQGFVYRDFQTRNIMIHNEKPFFIDYQGGLKGPVLYDLVSILWQAKADLSDEWKAEFYEIYVKEFIETTKQDLNGIEFQKAYELCVVERCLQVLGTYGFRGIFERKTHFLESIEFGLNNLKKIQNWNLLESYPELKKVISKLTEEETINRIKNKINE